MKQEETTPESGDGQLSGLFRRRYLPSTLQEYYRLYHESLAHREEYWKFQATRLDWDTPFTEIANEQFYDGAVRWFSDGRLNAFNNAIERHIADGRGGETAFVYLPVEGEPTLYTYAELKRESIRLATALNRAGIQTGDKAALYLPDCPETVIFMLACSLAAITYVPIPYHFTAEIATEIVRDSDARLLMIASETRSRSYTERIKAVSAAMEDITVVTIGGGNGISYERFIEGDDPDQAQVTNADAEHPLFFLYANSATGIPRGSVFPTAGYLVQAAQSYETLFMSVSPEGRQIACTLNLASAAGQSYGLWGPLLNGVCTIITEEGENAGVSMLNRILDLFASPSLIASPRLLTAVKNELEEKPLHGKNKFSHIACSGDVLTPRMVSFAGETLSYGAERIMNIWIQSESGTALIATLPTDELNRPGALGVPAFGITPKVMNNMGTKCRTNESGQLLFSTSWPGMIRIIWAQPDRFQELYFRRINGHFMTNDAVRLDAEGFYWFMGRLDDVVKVRGQSLATSEIEAVLVTHEKIAEAAVVSIPGEESDNLVAFLSFEKEFVDRGENAGSEELENELSAIVTARIGEFALPSRYIFARELPRTRTGKLVRRVLRRIATGDIAHDEDLSHVANPESVKNLIQDSE